MSRVVSSLSVVALAGVVCVLGATAANAAPTPGTLADGNELFVMEYDNNLTEDFVSVDVATGLTTKVGTSSLDSGWSGASFNPADGQIYAIELHEWNDPYTLHSINPATGAVTEIGALPDGVSAGALAIDADGNGFLIDWDENLYSIDLSDASTTLIGSFTAGGFGDVYGFAINPVDGRAYFAEFYGSHDIYEIDLSDASTTLIVNDYNVVFGQDSAAFAFDSNGTAWFQVERNTAELWSADINDFEATAQFETQVFNPDDAADAFYFEAMAITFPVDGIADSGAGDGGLAETGLDEMTALWWGAAFIVAGTIVFALRRRARN